MVHIILFILKLIGIILASILGILIFLILVVLLVPIRYRIDAKNKEFIQAEAKASWLFHLLFFRITFAENHFVIKLHIFGRVFYDSDKPKETVKKEVKQVAKSVVTQVEKQVEEKVEEKGEEKAEEKAEEKGEEKVEEKAEEKMNEFSSQEKLGELKTQKAINTPQLEQQMHFENIKPEAKKLEKNSILTDLNVTKKNKRKTIKRIFSKVKTFFNKIKTFFIKIIIFLKKIKALLLHIKETIININKKILGIRVIWHKLKDFLRDEINKAGLKHIFRSLRKIFQHIRPTKLRIEMEFGTGDPCSTGQALGALAILYGYYGEAIQIIPNFETTIFEGTIFCEGRIRLFTLLIICIKLILDKNFRKFIKNMKAFKEEL